jgi:prevent-host-death family protein
MIVNVHAAKTTLSKLIERAERGEEVIIARAGKPAVRLTPVAPIAMGVAERSAEFQGQSLPSWMGSMKGEIWIAPDAFEPDEELIRLMEDGPIFPPDEPGI